VSNLLNGLRSAPSLPAAAGNSDATLDGQADDHDVLQVNEAGDAGPFAGPHKGARALPFAIVAVLGTASILWPPGPSSPTEAFVSVGLLALVAGAFLLPWWRLPAWTTVFVPIVYTASVLLLVLSADSSITGIGMLMLLPVIWTALYHRPWESAVVVAATVVAQLVTSCIPVQLGAVVTTRKLVFWLLTAGLLSIATHTLRGHLHRNAESREARLRQLRGLVFAGQELAAVVEPDEVIETAVRLAAEIVSPPGTASRRAQYIRLDESGCASLVAQLDDTGAQVVESFRVDDHPNLKRVYSTGTAVSNRLDPGAAGPTVRKLVEKLGVLHGVYVPVRLDGQIDGVLSVSVRGHSVPPELFEQCKALGHFLELSLTSAKAHADLMKQSVTDPLTGLPNRRAFEALLAKRPGRSNFAIVALDLDGLKRVNDSLGHAAGDALLMRVAEVVGRALRRGDVLARIGGDEFAVLLLDTNEQEARSVADRILAELGSADGGGKLSVSLGLAVGEGDADTVKVQAAADEAMYRAKRAGGRRWELAVSGVI
jgi:diguanylate cyclase (GGDEF)-like protein